MNGMGGQFAGFGTPGGGIMDQAGQGNVPNNQNAGGQPSEGFDDLQHVFMGATEILDTLSNALRFEDPKAANVIESMKLKVDKVYQDRLKKKEDQQRMNQAMEMRAALP